MRFTVDVILHGDVRINPLRERELSLRGYKAPAIENLGVTKDSYDCIDFSDNEIKKLENFPRLLRLRMLLLCNNHITKIQDQLHEAIGNLQYLILTNNRIADLNEINQLRDFKKLDTLSLCGNPVTKQKFYREYIVYTLPQLRVLDFQRIKPADREAANMLFNSMTGVRIIQDIKQNKQIMDSTNAMSKVNLSRPAPPMSTTSMSIASPSKAIDMKEENKAVQNQSNQKKAQLEIENADTPMDIDTNSSLTVSSTKDASPKEEIVQTPVNKNNSMEDISMEDENVKQSETQYTPSMPISTMTVVILKKELQSLGLPTGGKKAELVARLTAASQQTGQ